LLEDANKPPDTRTPEEIIDTIKSKLKKIGGANESV
jgi:hypothetical protein